MINIDTVKGELSTSIKNLEDESLNNTKKISNQAYTDLSYSINFTGDTVVDLHRFDDTTTETDTKNMYKFKLQVDDGKKETVVITPKAMLKDVDLNTMPPSITWEDLTFDIVNSSIFSTIYGDYISEDSNKKISIVLNTNKDSPGTDIRIKSGSNANDVTNSSVVVEKYNLETEISGNSDFYNVFYRIICTKSGKLDGTNGEIEIIKIDTSHNETSLGKINPTNNTFFNIKNDSLQMKINDIMNDGIFVGDNFFIQVINKNSFLYPSLDFFENLFTGKFNGYKYKLLFNNQSSNDFTPAETITGNTSLNTATVVSEGDGYLEIKDLSGGYFIPNETITGSLSSASAIVSEPASYIYVSGKTDDITEETQKIEIEKKTNISMFTNDIFWINLDRTQAEGVIKSGNLSTNWGNPENGMVHKILYSANSFSEYLYIYYTTSSAQTETIDTNISINEWRIVFCNEEVSSSIYINKDITLNQASISIPVNNSSPSDGNIIEFMLIKQ